MKPMTDVVVLVDDHGHPIGTAPKATVHTTDTPLHLAFSCYVAHNGKILVTRRALLKKTWPGVWTNSACGHLAPQETAQQAVLRWVPHELGVPVRNLRCVLPEFRYRAVDSRGIVENEICPVFIAEVSGEVQPAADEVDSYQWVTPADLLAAVDAAPFTFSPWMVEQLAFPELRAALLALSA